MKKPYAEVGRKVFALYPKIAEQVMRQTIAANVLTDFKDIALLSEIFAEYYQMPGFPKSLNILPIKDSTEYRIKFTTFVLFCFDAESLKGPYFKKVKDGLRQELAEYLETHQSLISQYIPKARVYLQAYEDFENELSQLIAIAKLRVDQRKII